MRLTLLLALATTLSACAGSRMTSSSEPVRVEDLDAQGEGGHFTFYSLREGRIVPASDSASADWDLAFRTTTILVNGGAVGPGQGGALVLPDTAFAAVTDVPEGATFAVDQGTGMGATAIPGGAGNGWYDYDLTTGIVYPRPVVLLIRTADGRRVAKVEIESYYRGAPPVDELDPQEGFRFYTFRYAFLPQP